MSPRSHCTSCARTLTPLELVPVVSWLAQRAAAAVDGASRGAPDAAIGTPRPRRLSTTRPAAGRPGAAAGLSRHRPPVDRRRPSPSRRDRRGQLDEAKPSACRCTPIGRDRREWRAERLAVGVPDARGELSRHRAPSERRGDRGLPGRHAPRGLGLGPVEPPAPGRRRDPPDLPGAPDPQPDLRRRGRRLRGAGLGGRAAPPVRPGHPPAPIRETLTPASFTRRRRRIENAVDRLVFRTFLPDQPDTANARRLQARYREHRASLFVFFDRPDVPPTNNASEQDLRPSVIHRKVTGGYRSQLGADVSAILTSLLTTARKRGENLFQALRSVAGPSPLRRPGLPYVDQLPKPSFGRALECHEVRPWPAAGAEGERHEARQLLGGSISWPGAPRSAATFRVVSVAEIFVSCRPAGPGTHRRTRPAADGPSRPSIPA